MGADMWLALPMKDSAEAALGEVNERLAAGGLSITCEAWADWVECDNDYARGDRVFKATILPLGNSLLVIADVTSLKQVLQSGTHCPVARNHLTACMRDVLKLPRLSFFFRPIDFMRATSFFPTLPIPEGRPSTLPR